MNYNIKDIVREVQKVMDDYPSDTFLEIQDTDAFSLDDLIKSTIEDAAVMTETSAPIYMLDDNKPLAGIIEWASSSSVQSSGKMSLPEDFLRLVSFKMSDWSYPITEAITEESPLYPLQKQRFAGLKGSRSHPIVAIVTGTGGRILEFFSSESGSTIIASYIPYPKIGQDGTVYIVKRLYRAVVYMCASMVSNTMGETAVAEKFLNDSKELSQ